MRKMHVWCMKPIQLMNKGEKGFIAVGFFYLVFVEGKILLYINKNAPISFIETNGFIPIEKIGKGNDGKDFFIDFPKNIFYPSLSSIDIKVKECLFPVEIDFTIATAENVKSLVPDYEKLGFDDLLDTIWNYIDGPDFISNKAKVYEMMKYIKPSLANYISSFDEEALLIYQKGMVEAFDEEKKNPLGGERGKAVDYLYGKILSILSKEKENRKRSISIEDMGLEKLELELELAIGSGDYERASLIRDKIKEIKESMKQ